jgi:transcriptional regulator GlxA family with amidase domain
MHRLLVGLTCIVLAYVSIIAVCGVFYKVKIAICDAEIASIGKNMSARIDFLYTPECMSGALFSMIDVLRAANSLWRLHHPSKRVLPLRWRMIDAQGAVLEWPAWLGGNQEMSVPDMDLPPERTALVVPGLWMQNVPHLNRLVEASGAEIAMIAARHASGSVIAASFNSAILLARAGILDDKYASMTWMIAGWFAKTYPRVKLQMDRAVTQDGKIFCAGAPASHLELAIELIRYFVDKDLAQTCANTVLYQSSRLKQAGLNLQGMSTVTRDGVVYKAKQYLECHIADAYQLEIVAQAAAVSARTLLRHFQEVIGMTPLDYLHKLRIERAKQLLEVTLFGLPTIMEQCGYQDASSFRRLFKRETGLSPSEYRKAYTVRAPRQWWRAEDTDGSALLARSNAMETQG